MKTGSLISKLTLSGERLKSVLLMILTGVLLAGCATPPRPALKPLSQKPEADSVTTSLRAIADTISVPAGLDSSVAVAAALAAREVIIGAFEDSMAKVFFEQGQTERETGKPLFELFKKCRSQKGTITPQDSLLYIEYWNQATREGNQGQKFLGGKWASDYTPDSLKSLSELARRRAASCFERARDFLQQSLDYNPWDKDAQNDMFLTYLDLGLLHQSLGDYEAAINAIENALLVGKAGSDEYPLYWMLGECYSGKGDTLKALLKYRQGEDALITWAPFLSDSAAIGLDTTSHKNWLAFIEKECCCELALSDASSLMADLFRLKNACQPHIASEAALIAGVASRLEWLSWDGGNLQAAHLWDQATAASNQKDYSEARRIVNLLLPIVITPSARFEVEKGAALLDFNFLDQKDSGLVRMRKLVNEAGFCEVDSVLDSLLIRSGAAGFTQKMNEQRVAVDNKIKDLLKNYGNMCIVRARDYLEQKDKETAYLYYYQAALIPGEDQSFALYALSLLSSNMPRKVILYGEAALTPQLVAQLTIEERKKLCNGLMNAYKGLNDKPHAEHYRQELLALKNTTQPKESN